MSISRWMYFIEWIRKLWYIYTMEYYSVIKKNSFESVLMRWMKLEPIIQSEVSQEEKHQYSIRWSHSVVSDSVRPHRRQLTRLPRLWDSPGKNTGVGCHFLLQCIKVKSESEVAQLCPTLSDPMDCSPPGSSIHGIFQARVLEWGAITFSDKVVLITHNFAPPSATFESSSCSKPLATLSVIVY